MVAISILGLGLTAILTAQSGAVQTSTRARNIGRMLGFLRCKMTELEGHLNKDGFQEMEETGEGSCCNDESDPNVWCTWIIEKPKLPEPEYGDLDLNADLDLSKTGSFGNLAGVLDGKTSFDQGASPADIATQLAGNPQSNSDEASGLPEMVMQMVYPDLKRIFESGIRKVTVEVHWKEGKLERNMQIDQWVTNPKYIQAVDPSTTTFDTEKPK